MALDEPRDEDTRATVDGFDFVLSPRDAQLLSGGSEVRVDYIDDGWGKGFYLSTGRASSCAI